MQNARGYGWLGLTSANPGVRKANFDKMFRAVGQVMHLLQDTSQPQHVRNEQHLDTWWENGPNFMGLHNPNTPWRSPIEDYYKTHPLNYPHGMLDWKAAGFTKLEDFWSLAAWCNGNFLGARHLFPEYYKPGNVEYYPFPSRDTSTDYSDVKAHPANHVSTITLGNVTNGKAIYLAKTGDGIRYDHIVRVNYLGAKIPDLIGPTYCTINDPNVLKDYHDNFIPQAVKYSAGLLDYFFRGTLGVGVTNLPDGTACLSITNTSGQDFHGGGFHVFYDDTNAVRSELTGTNISVIYSDALLSGNSTFAFFWPQPGASNYLLVYQGTIGAASGSTSDSVDSGIAITANKFNFSACCVPDSGPPVPDGWEGATLPPRLRVKKYLTDVKPKLMLCDDCESASASEWDGNFDARDDWQESYYSTLYPVCINGKLIFRWEADDHSNGLVLYLNDSAEWQLFFGCEDSFVATEEDYSWVGDKKVGNSPVGTYIYSGGDAYCLKTLQCIIIEEY